MKYLIAFLFFSFSLSSFAKNNVEVLDVDVIEELTINETVINENLNTLKEATIAFECYYTMEWLYMESPFIERIVAFV